MRTDAFVNPIQPVPGMSLADFCAWLETEELIRRKMREMALAGEISHRWPRLAAEAADEFVNRWSSP